MLIQREDPKTAKTEILKCNVMNTAFHIEIEKNETDWKKAVLSFLHYMDREFSRFRENNELWRFNEARINSAVRVSPIFYDLLKKAETYRQKTGGRFSPYLLSPLKAHGYSQTFPFTTAGHEEADFDYELQSQPLLFQDNFLINKNTDQKIDLGGIAKGYAVEAIAQWLKRNIQSRYGLVDGGGDMAVWSNGEITWKIGIMNPFDETKTIGTFAIQNGGIATSNIIYRSWKQGNQKKHHLLDGRTGMPVDTDIVQATVITQHCLNSEIGAKLCFMADDMPLASLLANISEKFRYVLVKSDGKLEIGGNVTDARNAF